MVGLRSPAPRQERVSKRVEHCPHTSLRAGGDKILIGMGSRKKGGQELEADHTGNSFEKFCYKRVKRNCVVSHRKSGNKKNFCWLEKKQEYICIVMEWSLFS